MEPYRIDFIWDREKKWEPGPPHVWISGIPPLPGENYVDYDRRAFAEVMKDVDRPTLWQRIKRRFSHAL